MDMCSFILYLLFLLSFNKTVESSFFPQPHIHAHYMSPGSQINVPTTDSQTFNIFCYRGNNKHFMNTWNSVFLELTLDPQKYDSYDGSSPDEVKEAFQNKNIFTNGLLFWKMKDITLNPFNSSCIGIDPHEKNINYNIKLHLLRVDYWRILMFIAGLSCFFYAQSLSQNNLFYYTSGVFIGVFATLLILVYFLSRMIPKRSLMYGFIIGGCSVSIYFLNMLIHNLSAIIFQYQNFVIIYTTITGLISFIICYRFGPVTDNRSKNLIKWGMQAFGLILIFFCSHYQEAMIAIIVIILVGYNFPHSWKISLKYYWKNKFPPKRKLLTEEEYYEQGVVETTKALKELKSYCTSPECDAWKTMTKLKNPIRFATFMNGKSHLEDEEILEYEINNHKTATNYLTDDDDDDDEDSEY